MNEGIDWQAERARAGSHTQRSLAALAVRAGWYEVKARGKGSHRFFKRDGVPGPVVIPTDPRVNTVRAILKGLGGRDA